MLIAKTQKTRRENTPPARLAFALKILALSAAFASVVLGGQPAQAGSSKATMQVRATVLPECTFMTPNVNFEAFTGKRVQITIENERACTAIGNLDRPVITAEAGPPNVEPGCELKTLPTTHAAPIYEACYSLDGGTEVAPDTVLWTVTF